MKTKNLTGITIASFLSLIILLCLSACSKDSIYIGEDPQPDDRAKLVFCQKNVEMSVEQVKKLVKDTMLCNRIKYGITCYKVRYKTLYFDKLVDADALLIIPQYAPGDSARFATYFHGTILPFQMSIVDTSLPSDFAGKSSSKDVVYCSIPLAAAGFCVVTPDYTGYGPTSHLDHPFVYYPELFKSASDGVKVCNGIVNKMMFDTNHPMKPNDIWLSGWSQGGGLSMYAHREYQKGVDGFHVRANSTLAGPFNINHFMLDMMETPEDIRLAIALYSWAAFAINEFGEDLRRPSDQIFRLDIFDQKSSILVMSTSPQELFQDFFMKNICNGKDTKYIHAMDLTTTSHGWVPQAPVFMYHGTNDKLVPFFNMTDAFEGLGGKNPGSKVHMFPEEGGGHDTFVPKYMSKTIDSFLAN